MRHSALLDRNVNTLQGSIVINEALRNMSRRKIVIIKIRESNIHCALVMGM